MLSLMMARAGVRGLEADDRGLLAALVKKLEEEGLTGARHFALLSRDGGRKLRETVFIDPTWLGLLRRRGGRRGGVPDDGLSNKVD